MAIKSVVTCDLTGRELEVSDINEATVVVVQFKKIGTVPGYGKDPDVRCITEVDNYEFHVCSEKAPAFMEELKKLMNRMKE